MTILRQDVLMRVSKGVIMPGMPLQAWKLARWADVVHLHVPQLDAAYISLIARSWESRSCSPTTATSTCPPA